MIGIASAFIFGISVGVIGLWGYCWLKICDEESEKRDK